MDVWEVKHRLDHLLGTIGRKPILIQKRGRSVAVLLSVQEYERLEIVEDADHRAEKAPPASAVAAG